VFLCEDQDAGMPVALKTFHLHQRQDRKKLSTSFQKEADTWIQIGRQFNVVRAYEVFNLETDEGLWPILVTELVEGNPRFGASLSGWIEHNALDLRLILLFAYEICSGMVETQIALEAIGRGTELVHGDLKPQNILISSEGAVKITDFGIAKIFGPQKVLSLPIVRPTKARSFCHTSVGWGTPAYMSPEQCAGRSRSPLSDIYSFGCVLYEMYTGHLIFDSDTSEDFIQKHTCGSIIPPEARNPKVPQMLSAIIKQCLDKNPVKRPQSFMALRDLIDSLITERNYPRLLFFMFGFSAFTDEPKIRKDLDMNQEGQVLALDAACGPEYVVKQGLAASVEEVASIIRRYKDRDKNEREKESCQHKVDDYLVTGDSFFKLSESADSGSQDEPLRSALLHYRLADELMPNEPRIIFRLGMVCNNLGETVKQEKPLLSVDFLEQAKKCFTRVLQSDFTPFFVAIGNTLYFLPYHALFYRAASYLYEGNLSKGIAEFESLIVWTQKASESVVEESDRWCLHELGEGAKKVVGVVKSEAKE